MVRENTAGARSINKAEGREIQNSLPKESHWNLAPRAIATNRAVKNVQTWYKAELIEGDDKHEGTLPNLWIQIDLWHSWVSGNSQQHFAESGENRSYKAERGIFAISWRLAEMGGSNGTTPGGEAICRVCCSWSALGWVDVVTKTSLCSALFRCWPSALRLTSFGNMDEEMKTWACLKDLNLKMAGPGEGFWVQACRSCKRGLVFTRKLMWNIVKVFLLVQPLPTQKNPSLQKVAGET